LARTMNYEPPSWGWKLPDYTVAHRRK
jgi:hypothetical protein